jgi:type I restriction enzyme S subunit
LLIVEGNGSHDQIGRVALWNGEIQPCVHQNHLIKIRIFEDGIRKFCLFWLLSPEGRKIIESVASSTSGLFTLNISKVSSLPIPLPPLEEQIETTSIIEELFSCIDSLNNKLNTGLSRIARIRQSILSRTFCGQLIN